MKHQKTIKHLARKFSLLAGLAEKYSLPEYVDRMQQQKRDLDEPLLIMVVGKGNFGKSTLINALVGCDVAPVSIKPKTWKVDLYQTTQQEERAELTWAHQPHAPVRCSIKEAERICEEQESIAKQKKRERETWKSELLQVRWFRKLEWPSSQDVVLVDTPGFSQERSDVQVEKFYIHGSQGFQIETNDPFEYYYDRSEIVLWCIKATNIEDQSTKESMQKVCGQNTSREVIGLLTFGDRIPEEDKERVRQRALELFGEWVKDFFYVSAGEESVEKKKSISFLREKIQKQFISRAIDYKVQQKEKHFLFESANVLLPVSTFMDLAAYNARQLTETEIEGANTADRVFDAMVGVLKQTWDNLEQKAKSQIDQFWNESKGESAAFEEKMKKKSFHWKNVQKKNYEILEEAQRKLQVGCRSLFHQLKWRGASVGSFGLSIKQMQATFTLEEVTFEESANFEFSLSGLEGFGVGAMTGVAGAVIGALVLGPVGAIAGAALSAWLGGAAGRETEIKKKASQSISSCAEHYKQTVTTELANLSSKTKAVFREELQRSFHLHHGRELATMLPLAQETDVYLREIESWPKDRQIVRQPTSSLLCCYEPMFLEFSPAEAVKWNEALDKKIQSGIEKYKQQCEQGFLAWKSTGESKINTLDVSDSQFGFLDFSALSDVLKDHPNKIAFFEASFLDEIQQSVFSNGICAETRLVEVFEEQKRELLNRLAEHQASLRNRWIDVLAALCFEVLDLRKDAIFFPSKHHIFQLHRTRIIDKFSTSLTEAILHGYDLRKENASFSSSEWQFLGDKNIPDQFNAMLSQSLSEHQPKIEIECEEVFYFEVNAETREATKRTIAHQLHSALNTQLSQRSFEKQYSFRSVPITSANSVCVLAWLALIGSGNAAFIPGQATWALGVAAFSIFVLVLYYSTLSSFRESVKSDACELLGRFFSATHENLKEALRSPQHKHNIADLDAARVKQFLERIQSTEATEQNTKQPNNTGE